MYLSFCVLIGQGRWLTATVIAGQKREGERERKKYDIGGEKVKSMMF